MGRLEQAIALAATAHAGQVDKAGEPYILHVVRVMLRCDDEDTRIAAALHDVVEDCGFTVDDIRSQFGDRVANAVDAVSRRDGETYHDFMERAALDPIGRAVKIADLLDNLDETRLPIKTDGEQRRVNRYRIALRRLAFPSAN